MNNLRVLLVDDEPHVIDAMTSLLEQSDEFALDIYCASSAKAALQVLSEGRIDLVISDIEMPGMNGIELLKEINRRWPQCRTIFLTAYPSFQYAYQAIQYHLANYLLKTEEDDVLLEKILMVLREINESLRLKEQVFSAQSAEGFSPQLSRALKANAEETTRLPGGKYCLLLCVPDDGKKRVRVEALHELMRYYLQDVVESLCYARPAENCIVWLVKFADGAQQETRLFGQIEMAQVSCQATFGATLSMIMQPFEAESCSVFEAYQKAGTQRARIADGKDGVLYRVMSDETVTDTEDIVGMTIGWLRHYIDENICSDVSLMRLSALSGYNAQYLSGIFKQRTGTTISRYVAVRRMRKAKELLLDMSLSLQDISRMLGFSSRSYFNHFIKQESGITPQQLREKITNEPAEE